MFSGHVCVHGSHNLHAIEPPMCGIDPAHCAGGFDPSCPIVFLQCVHCVCACKSCICVFQSHRNFIGISKKLKFVLTDALVHFVMLLLVIAVDFRLKIRFVSQLT